VYVARKPRSPMASFDLFSASSMACGKAFKGNRVLLKDLKRKHPELFNINFDDLRHVLPLDAGGQATVFQAHLRQDGGKKDELVAVKQLAADTESRHHLLALRREIKYLRTMDHPNVLRYLGLTSKGDCWLFMVTELMTGGNLQHVISKMARAGTRLFSKKRNPPSWCHIASLALQFVQGIAFLHQFSMLHRDLKPNNLLLSEDWCVLKICDFGLARLVKEKEPPANQQDAESQNDGHEDEHKKDAADGDHSEGNDDAEEATAESRNEKERRKSPSVSKKASKREKKKEREKEQRRKQKKKEEKEKESARGAADGGKSSHSRKGSRVRFRSRQQHGEDTADRQPAPDPSSDAVSAVTPAAAVSAVSLLVTPAAAAESAFSCSSDAEANVAERWVPATRSADVVPPAPSDPDLCNDVEQAERSLSPSANPNPTLTPSVVVTSRPRSRSDTGMRALQIRVEEHHRHNQQQQQHNHSSNLGSTEGPESKDEVVFSAAGEDDDDDDLLDLGEKAAHRSASGADTRNSGTSTVDTRTAVNRRQSSRQKSSNESQLAGSPPAVVGFTGAMDMVHWDRAYERARVRSQRRKKLARCGTEGFMAPEVLKSEPYGLPADMFSFGCVLVQMLTLRGDLPKPVRVEKSVTDEAQWNAEWQAKLFEGTPEVLIEIAKGCVNFDAEKRPMAIELEPKLRLLLDEYRDSEDYQRWVLGEKKAPRRGRKDSKGKKEDGKKRSLSQDARETRLQDRLCKQQSFGN